MNATHDTSTAAFATRITERDHIAIATFSGEASFEQADALRDELLRAAERPINAFIVDLTGLTYITSVGLGAIVAAYLRCRRRDIEFRVAGARGKVQSMFEVTRLDRLFRLEPTLDAALRDLPT